MAKKASNTTADGSILGYLFQIERALLWLSELSNECIVGVEVDDDILVKLENGESIDKIYEQSKHSVSKAIPYSDHSIDLWKTLYNWINLIEDKKCDIDKSIFSILSNKKIPSNRLISKISKINDKSSSKEIEDIIITLKDIAIKLPVKKQKYGNKILDCSNDFLKQFLIRIQILDNSYTHSSNEIKKHIKANLSVSEDIPFNKIYQSLFGFVLDNLIECWKERKEGLISVNSFNKQYNILIYEFLEKPFFEKTIDSLPISVEEIEGNRGKNFVKQLSLIDCEDDEIIEAINDYVRAASERSRWARDGEISKANIEVYFQDLKTHWDSISRPKFKYSSDFKRTGYETFYETILYRGKILNFEPIQSYTNRGSYHYLCDSLKIGWHPLWKDLTKKK
ncbi:ABC-three component system protein [Sphingobacterium bovisgrunnientis]|uniref:ABC-three component system protein n=1 Tax=Sphingobacterium bovisgrunnientis TaxID=1874697 RepID=UPI00135A05E4|nr:ABC-three component system protein [Sphingobacterium bovisgrunnientis]